MRRPYPLDWTGVQAIPSQQYFCSYCGNSLASDKGYAALSTYDRKPHAWIAICHTCQNPTFIDENKVQTPGAVFGAPVHDVPEPSVEQLYDEARKCVSTNSYTAAVLCCRKLLMHIAVAKGAKEGLSFVKYVEYLADKNFIPPDAREWVDHIRTRSNEANHEITIMTRDDAEELISFCEMLLKVIYEFPAAIRRRRLPPAPAT